jgi:hypothetical protein
MPATATWASGPTACWMTSPKPYPIPYPMPTAHVEERPDHVRDPEGKRRQPAGARQWPGEDAGTHHESGKEDSKRPVTRY